MNRDTPYSAAVFDLDAGPVTITLPAPGRRFMAMQLISQDDYSPPAAYGAGKHTITKQRVGTRYVLVGVRTLRTPEVMEISWRFKDFATTPIRRLSADPCQGIGSLWH
jgi:hypothetical protein